MGNSEPIFPWMGPSLRCLEAHRVALRVASVARRSFTGTAQLDPVTCESLCRLN